MTPRVVFAGMLAVAIAFGVALPFGFWAHARFPAMQDAVLGTMVAVILVGVAAGMMWLLARPWRLDGGKLEGRRTGYELTYEKFFRLVSDPYSQPVIAPLLKDWYRYAIAGEGSTTVVLSEHDIVVALHGLHNQIQNDPQKQYTIYQRAMDLWR
jgi:hypothetical protein